MFLNIAKIMLAQWIFFINDRKIYNFCATTRFFVYFWNSTRFLNEYWVFMVQKRGRGNPPSPTPRYAPMMHSIHLMFHSIHLMIHSVNLIIFSIYLDKTCIDLNIIEQIWNEWEGKKDTPKKIKQTRANRGIQTSFFLSYKIAKIVLDLYWMKIQQSPWFWIIN